MTQGTPETRHRIEITGNLSRQAIEAIYLELRQIAKRGGAAIEGFWITPAGGAPVAKKPERTKTS